MYGLIAQEVKEALKAAHPDNYTLDAMVVHTPNEAGEYIGEDDEFEGWALRYLQVKQRCASLPSSISQLESMQQCYLCLI